MSAQVVIIGSFLLVGACIAVAAFATSTYRNSRALAHAAVSSEPGMPLELICGIRLGLFNATWPAGRCRLGEEGVGFTCLGFTARANWADVEAVELIKPMNQIGWGVRFRVPSMKPTSAIVWLGSQQLADKVIDTCAFHEVPTDKKARAVL
jgi:hypothetical protein